MTADEVAPKRFRFTLRSLLAAVTALCVLRGTRITDDGLRKLRVALPNCAITR